VVLAIAVVLLPHFGSLVRPPSAAPPGTATVVVSRWVTPERDRLKRFPRARPGGVRRSAAVPPAWPAAVARTRRCGR